MCRGRSGSTEPPAAGANVPSTATSTLNPRRGGGDGAFPPRWQHRRNPSGGGHGPPAPSPAQVRMPQPGKAATTAGAEGQGGAGEWEEAAMRPFQRSVTFRSPRAAPPRAGHAGHFELPRDTGSPGAPRDGATGTESAQGRKENTQNKPYLHPKSAAPHLEEGTRVPRCPGTPCPQRQ